MKLHKIFEISADIVVKSGLHVGGNKDSIEIGGIDNPVIKDALTGRPYIPGSSLKGKTRSMLEWYEGKIDVPEGKVHNCDDPECPICRIFGTTAKGWQAGPTRVVFRDANLSEESLKQIELSQVMYEEKTENAINRVQGKAEHPRVTERVPAGTVFNFQVTYKALDLGDNANADISNLQLLWKGLKLLTLDYIGGSGTRGYGQIAFRNMVRKDLMTGEEEPINLDEIEL